MIASIETALVARLAALFPEFRVEGFPLEGAYQFKAAKGAILVGYVGSSFATTGYEFGATALQSLNSIPENREMEFEIRLYVRQFQNHQDLYGLLQQILEARTGFRPAGAGEMLPLREKIEGQTDGVWQSYLIFKTHSP